MFIRGIYKLPVLKHAFIIVDSLEGLSDSLQPSQGHKKRMECFERILRSKDRSIPTDTQQWTLKIMSESDFVKVLEQHNPKGRVSSNQTSCNPEHLELLAINLLKAPEILSDWTLVSPKVLSSIPDEDIIEVFI